MKPKNFQKEALTMMADANAVITDGHFVYKSGDHGQAYVNKDALLLHPRKAMALGSMLAQTFGGQNIEVVIGPAVAGAQLALATAYYMTVLEDREVLSTFADKDGDGFVIKRGYEKVIPGKRTLVVEDIVTTGGSANGVLHCVQGIEGIVVGLGVVCNRGGLTAETFGLQNFQALANVTFETHPPDACPLCRAGVPINTKLGHGAKFLQARQ